MSGIFAVLPSQPDKTKVVTIVTIPTLDFCKLIMRIKCVNVSVLAKSRLDDTSFE